MPHSLQHPKLEKILGREDIAQLTPKWFEWRGRMVTASQVAAVLGVDPYKSAVQLFKEKCWPETRQDSSSFATRHGNQYEDDAILKYEQVTGRKVLRIGLLQHEKHPWVGASPDGIAVGKADEEPRGVEAKCPVSRQITSEVPHHYSPQVQLQLEVLDLEEADFIQVPFSSHEYRLASATISPSSPGRTAAGCC